MRSYKSKRKADIGRSLESYRVACGLTQAELAAQLQTSQPTLSRILADKGNPRPALRQRIAAFLTTREAIPLPDGWTATVLKAAEGSPAFRAIIDAGLRLVNKDG